MKKKIIMLLFLCIEIQLFGQSNISPLVDFPSPNAASLGVYGQIPVDHFTGIPDISIPIHTIQIKGIQLPITLRYHLASVKPDVTPGWTGLGWVLEAGGSITRIINGKKDEMTKNEVSLISNVTPSENVGYYYRSSELVNNANWTTNDSLLNYSMQKFNVVRYYTDLEPDEFMFNFAGMNGSFFYNGTNNGTDQFKFKSKQPLDLKISLNIVANTDLEVFKKLQDYPASSRSLPLRNYISKFTVIDSKGIKYEFGGNTDAIDFTTTPVSNGSSVNTNTTAITWYLTAITTPDGEKIQFNYKKDGDFFINSNARSKMVRYYTYSNSQTQGQTLYDIGSNNDDYFAIQHLSYLESITTPIETVTFSSSPSSELTYNYDRFGSSAGNFGGSNAINMILREHYYSHCLDKGGGNYKLQLNQISISNKTENIKNFYFTYSNTSSQRLRLGELRTDDSKYQFRYNSTYLPGYNSKRTDHWGFYNNKYYGDKGYSTLADFRTPAEDYMKAETLEKIIYPTKGVTEFVYEAHDYSKVATLYSDLAHLFSLKNESGTAGGLRIRKITSRPDSTSNDGQVVKEYFYKNPDNTSSGILSGKPAYDIDLRSNIQTSNPWLESFLYLSSPNRVTYIVSSENHLNPLGNTNGSHITYSRITEKFADQSSSIYCYTNQDDQGDALPVKVLTNIQYASLFIEPFDSKEIGRGLLKNEIHKNSLGITIDSISYQYGYKYDDYVKSLAINRLGDFDRFACIKRYTFVPKLIEKKEINNLDGSNPVVVQTNYVYNNRNFVSEKNYSGSKGEELKTKYKYASDYNFTGSNVSDRGILQSMNQKNMTEYLVEEQALIKQSGSWSLLNGKLTKYNKFGDNIIKPGTSYILETEQPFTNFIQSEINGTGDLSFDSHYKGRVSYSKYDIYGNLNFITINDLEKIVYLWSYKGQYPIAEIHAGNYTFTEVETSVKSVFSVTSLDMLSQQETPNESILKNGSLQNALPGALVTTYTYKPVVGVSSATDPRGVTTSYEYEYGRLKIIKDKNSNNIESYDYHYKN